MRDEAWLQQLLDDTWDGYFGDVPQQNIVRIEFGRKARTRLGSIRVSPKDPEVSIITMNGLFRDSSIPEFVVKATLVHELSHYAHGFNSPIEQKHRHPHAGGVMRQEFAERGLEDLYVQQKKWLKENWLEVIKANFSSPRLGRTSRKIVVRRTTKIPRPFWFLDF